MKMAGGGGVDLLGLICWRWGIVLNMHGGLLDKEVRRYLAKKMRV